MRSVLLTMTLCLASCLNPRPGPPEESKSDEFFEPQRYGQYQFEWAPDGVPVKFHHRDETRDNPDEWHYWDFTDPGPVELAIHNKLLFRNDPDYGELFRRVYAQRPMRPIFVGLGGPFIDDQLHMFECFSDHRTTYFMGDYVARCNSLHVGLLRAENSPAPPGHPQVSDRFYRWWRTFGTLKRADGVDVTATGEPELGRPYEPRFVDVFIYFPSEGRGFRRPRRIQEKSGWYERDKLRHRVLNLLGPREEYGGAR